MKIIKLEYKNFNSYGNKPVCIDFADNGSMIMLIGQSGFGKSTIREVISFLIYGKVQNKNLGDLPNRINKSLWGKITLLSNGSVITIERGISPKVCVIHIDGVLKDDAGSLNVQNVIENDYIKIPQTTFDNIVSISVDKFKSFLSMKPQDKRKILDQIFGILFFNKIYELLKEQSKEYNNQIKNLTGQVHVLNQNKKTIQDKITQIEQDKSKNLTENLNKVILEIETFTASLTEHTNRLELISDKSVKVIQKLNELNKTKTEISYKIKDSVNKLEVYEKETCPTCNSNLKDDFHKHNKQLIHTQKISLEEKLSETKQAISELNETFTKIEKLRTQINNNIFNTKLKLNNLLLEKEQLDKPTQKNNDFHIVLESTINKINEILNEIESNKKDEFLYNELSKIFGDDGIKLQIIKNYLPSFNKSINECNKKLHFPYKIEIDEKFNSKIYSIGEEINFSTLSTGEKKKADVSVLLSLIYIMKRNYPTINLLFLDEILASLDTYGVHEILNLIKSVSEELELNTFVINHSILPKEMFDFIFTVNKVSGFSELEITTC